MALYRIRVRFVQTVVGRPSEARTDYYTRNTPSAYRPGRHRLAHRYYAQTWKTAAGALRAAESLRAVILALSSADARIAVEAEDHCPHCGGTGVAYRTVTEPAP